MSCSKLIPVVLLAACLAMPATAHAQRGGGGHAGGGGSHAVGTAVPRGGAPAPGHPIAGPPGRPGYPGGPGHVGGPGYPGYGYRPYYPYYGHYYPYYGYGYGYPYYYPGFSFGFSYGYPYYSYPYPYYYPYAYGYPYPYPVAAAGAPESSNSVTMTSMGGIRILDVPGEAQVYADGSLAGRVDDFDQPSQQLSLAPGVHQIEIRIPGQPSKIFDVNIQAGQTINYHAR